MQKIVMLDLADIIVVNKSDQERARTAMSEIEQRLRQNKRPQSVISTVAKRHRDAGVDELCDLLSQKSGAAVSNRRTSRRSQSDATKGRVKK